MNRRTFLHATLTGMASVAMFSRAIASGSIDGTIAEPARQWLREVAAATQGVRGATLSQREWQRAISALFDRVPLPDILAAVDFERLAGALVLPDDRAGTIDPRLPDIEGLPRWPGCGLRLFGMQQGRAIVPHGHANMMSAHLVVHGQVHVRHYDRIDEDAGTLWLRPTIDQLSSPGDGTTVSDDQDNVHWLVARSPKAWTLDFIAVDLDRSRATRWGDFVDLRAASAAPDGTLRAPRLDFQSAIARYGREG
jgi:hypothetical protein